MDTVSNLLEILNYGKANALTSAELFKKVNPDCSYDVFRRKLKLVSAEARKMGHRIIGDDNGYYKPINQQEWEDYKRRRFAAIRDELMSFSSVEKLSVKDLIKDVYAVNVEDNNYNLQL